MRPLHRVPLRRFIPRDWRYPREHPKTLHCYLQSWRPLHAPPPLQRDCLSARFWAIYFFYELPSVPHESQGKRWTLAQAIADKSTGKPSDVRVRFAVGIATAVMFTHAVGLVHKSICPENILSFVVTVFLKMSRNPDIYLVLSSSFRSNGN